MTKTGTTSTQVDSALELVVAPSASAIPRKEPPLYLSIHERILKKIQSKEIPVGTQIKEGPLATVFGVSRAPVRRALQMLADAALIKPAIGQGYIVGDGTSGTSLSSQNLQAIFRDKGKSEMGRAATWESIYDVLRLDVISCLPFGTFQISESIACDHFSVGRTALREALSKLQNQGLLEKSNRSHWIAGPLTARDVHDAFEVRSLLEPAAIVQSVRTVDNATLQKMLKKVRAAISNLSATSPEDIEDIENDLHQVLLENTMNRRLKEAIDRNQLPFIVNKIFRRNFGMKTDLAALNDHSEILDQLLRNRLEVAKSMLIDHLTKAEKSTLAKLRVLSTLPKPVTAPYLINVH